MNKKILGAILVIIGLIALIGAGVFIYLIAEFSTAMGMLSTADQTIIAQYGIDAGQIGAMVGTLQTIITVGTVWCITVLITSLYAIYAGINMLRKR